MHKKKLSMMVKKQRKTCFKWATKTNEQSSLEEQRNILLQHEKQKQMNVLFLNQKHRHKIKLYLTDKPREINKLLLNKRKLPSLS